MARGYFPPRPAEFKDCQTESVSNNTTQGQDTSMNRSQGLTIPLNEMAIPIYTGPQSQEDVIIGGQVLFHNFVHEEFENEGLSDEMLLDEDPLPGASGDITAAAFHRASTSSASNIPEGYSNSQWVNIGSNLREISNQFAVSRERVLIREQADGIDVSGLTQESFFELLSSYFQDGINPVSIVALFYFCTDVLKNCVRKELRTIGAQLFFWCLRFISDRVCKWVYDNGGWEKVFFKLYKVIYRSVAIAALGVFIVCGFVWLRKNW